MCVAGKCVATIQVRTNSHSIHHRRRPKHSQVELRRQNGTMCVGKLRDRTATGGDFCVGIFSGKV